MSPRGRAGHGHSVRAAGSLSAKGRKTEHGGRWPAIVATAAAIALAATGTAGAAVDVVATGLDAPRGLDVTKRSVFVAEAGRGGETCVGDGVAQRCFGLSGAVTRISRATGEAVRTATGLPSLSAPGGGGAAGPSDVAMGGYRPVLLIGLGADPALRALLGEDAAGLGTLHRLTGAGRIGPRIVDVAAHEGTDDPDGAGPDSDPRSVAVGGSLPVVADAGANTVLRAGRAGVETLAVLPVQTASLPDGSGETLAPAVPTSVVRDEDGSYLVGRLTGFPFPVGGASVVRVPAEGGEPVPVATGFTTVTDLALGKDGSLYVLQLSSNGLLGDPGPSRLIRIAPDGTRSELAAGRLSAAVGMDIAKDGTIYVADGSAAPGQGRILEITPDELLASFESAGRAVEIFRGDDGPYLRLDGTCRVTGPAYAETAAGWTSALLPFSAYDSAEALARALVESDGMLYVLCDGGPA